MSVFPSTLANQEPVPGRFNFLTCHSNRERAGGVGGGVRWPRLACVCPLQDPPPPRRDTRNRLVWVHRHCAIPRSHSSPLSSRPPILSFPRSTDLRHYLQTTYESTLSPLLHSGIGEFRSVQTQITVHHFFPHRNRLPRCQLVGTYSYVTSNSKKDTTFYPRLVWQIGFVVSAIPAVLKNTPRASAFPHTPNPSIHLPAPFSPPPPLLAEPMPRNIL